MPSAIAATASPAGTAGAVTAGVAARTVGGGGGGSITAGSGFDFDVVIVGGGPAGSSAVSICTWLQKRVCVVDPRGHLCPAPTGAVSKIHRSCGMAHGDPAGARRVPWAMVDENLRTTLERVRQLPLPHEGVTRRQLRDDGGAAAASDGAADCAAAAAAAPPLPPTVQVLQGFARMADAHTVEVHESGETAAAAGRPLRRVTADVILIASGSVPSHLPGVAFDGRYVFDSDDIADIGRTPHRVVVQGAGIIGVEYAFIMRSLGAEVVMVEFAPALLPQLDVDVREAIRDQLRRVGIRLVLNAVLKVLSVPPARDGETPADRDCPESVHVRIEPRQDTGGGGGGGKAADGVQEPPFEVLCDTVLSATGRGGNTAGMNLQGIGCHVNRRHCVEVQERSQWTGVGRVYAAGDVAGPSALQPHGLVTTGQAQAIRAIYSAFVNEWPSGQLQAQYFENVPVALWLTPDVAYVGLSEATAVKRYGADAVGTSRADYSATIKYCVTPRPGFVKLVYLLDGGRIVGAHLFGEDTTEMIHYGAVLVNCHHTVFDVVKEVMAGVTYQEAYRTAGLDASKRVSAHLKHLASRL